MWVNDNAKMQKLVEMTGSPYAACLYAAKKGRQLQKETQNVLSESEALTWAISGEPPASLDARLRKKNQEAEEVKESDRIDNILSMIEEDKIRQAVSNSYKASVRSHRVIFDYNGIKDKGIRTRIRILVRMLFLG